MNNNYNKAKEKLNRELEEHGSLHDKRCGVNSETDCDCDMKGMKSFFSTFADTIQRATKEDAVDSIDVILRKFYGRNTTDEEGNNLLDEIIKWRKALLQKGEE